LKIGNYEYGKQGNKTKRCLILSQLMVLLLINIDQYYVFIIKEGTSFESTSLTIILLLFLLHIAIPFLNILFYFILFYEL